MSAPMTRKAGSFSYNILRNYGAFSRFSRLASCSIRCPNISSQITQRALLPAATQYQQLYSTDALQTQAAEEKDDLFKEIEVEVKGHEPAVLKSYEMFVTLAAKELDINLANISTPPRIMERRTLLKSVHIYKKHRVQYEMRTYFKSFQFKHLTGSTANTFLEYIQRNLPEGVAMKVTKHRIEALPDHIKPPSAQTASPQIEGSS